MDYLILDPLKRCLPSKVCISMRYCSGSKHNKVRGINKQSSLADNFGPCYDKVLYIIFGDPERENIFSRQDLESIRSKRDIWYEGKGHGFGIECVPVSVFSLF